MNWNRAVRRIQVSDAIRNNPTALASVIAKTKQELADEYPNATNFDVVLNRSHATRGRLSWWKFWQSAPYEYVWTLKVTADVNPAELLKESVYVHEEEE